MKKCTMAIPIKSIVSIQNSITIQRKGDVPLLQLVQDPNAKVDSMQVYTNDMRLHLFYKFFGWKNTEFFNVLQKCWYASFMNIQINYTEVNPYIFYLIFFWVLTKK